MATPARPVQDGLIDPAWGQWVHDDTLRTSQIRAKTIPNAAFDGSGLYYLTAATMGLASIDGAVWNLYNSVNNPTAQATQLVAGMAYRVDANTLILVGYAFAHPNGTMSRIGAGAITQIYVVAWGTAPAADEPAFKPGPDGEDELPEAKPA